MSVNSTSENTDAPDGVADTYRAARTQTPHPLWCRPVTISWLGPNQYEATYDGKSSGPLCLEEVFAVVAALTGANVTAPILGCFQTPEQAAAREEASRKRAEARAAETAARLHMEMATADAESISLGLADVLCWVNGFNAARQDGSGPSGLGDLRRIKTLIDRALMAKQQEKAS